MNSFYICEVYSIQGMMFLYKVATGALYLNFGGPQNLSNFVIYFTINNINKDHEKIKPLKYWNREKFIFVSKKNY